MKVSSSSSAVAGPPPTEKCSFGFFFNDAAEETQPVLSPQLHVKTELDAYEVIPKLDPEEDLLQWWKVQSSPVVDSPGFQVHTNLHNHIYQCVQQALHLNVCSAPQATLSQPQRASLKPD